MNKLKGIFPALVTPFDKEGKIDAKAIERLVEFHLKNGVDGFYIGGSSGEGFLLNLEERKYVIDAVMSAVSGRATVISHVGALSTNEAVTLADYSSKKGCDAISSVPPFYYKYSFTEIKKYYTDIVAASSIPMIIYHIPNLTGVSFAVENIRELFENEGIIGMKYTSTDFFILQSLISSYPEKLFYNGFDEDLIAGFAVGAHGGIGTTYNFMSDKFVKIHKLCKENNFDEARKIQDTVNKVVSVLLEVGVIPGTKEILSQLGLAENVCRAPFISLGDDAKKIIAERAIPLLK